MNTDRGAAPSSDRAENGDTENRLRRLEAIRADLDHDQLSELDTMIEEVDPDEAEVNGIDSGLDRTAGSGGLTPDLGDDELVSRWQQGDDQAFVEIVRRHRALLWNVALRLLRDHEEASDAVQEAFASAHYRRHTLASPSVLEGWLVATVTNRCGEIMRRRSAGAFRADAAQTPDGAVAGIELERVMDELGADDLVLVTLVSVGYDRAILARALGVSEETVSRRLARVRLQLAREPGFLPENTPRNL